MFKIWELEKYKSLISKLEKSSHAVILHSKDKMLLEAISKLFVMKSECLDSHKPCFVCTNCSKILDGNSIDIEVFGSEKAILVEDSQKIVEDSFVLPLELKKKYFILKNFENSTVQAQNKLLKVIEEPRLFDKFILLVDNLDAVLSTIKSRCEIYTVPKFEDDELKTIFDFNIGDGSKVNFAVQYADGNLTTLNTIFNDDEFSEIYSLCRCILTNMQNSSMVLDFTFEISKHKDKIEMFFDVLSVIYRDIIAIKNNKQNLVQNKEIINELLVLANGISELALVNILKEIEISRQSLKYNANFSSVIDNLLLKILEIKHICK